MCSLASSLQVMVKANNYKQIWSMELTKKACKDKKPSLILYESALMQKYLWT